MIGIFLSLWFGFTDTRSSEPLAAYGFLDKPTYSIKRIRRGPSQEYTPQAGDILLYSDPDIFWATMYFMAGTGAPGHAGLVARNLDGTMSVLEAGYNESLWVRFVPLDQRLKDYPGTIWVRSRLTPISPEADLRLTEFAHLVDCRRYSAVRLLSQLTPFRARGPLRTIWFGKPRGIRNDYICSEAVLEGLVYAGLLDAKTTRPSATYPRDMFFDHSMNPYINRHLKLQCSWQVPALWQPTPAPMP